MGKKYYRSTEAPLSENDYDYHGCYEGKHPVLPDPAPPDNRAWDLKGAIAHEDRVIWFWQLDPELDPEE